VIPELSIPFRRGSVLDTSAVSFCMGRRYVFFNLVKETLLLLTPNSYRCYHADSEGDALFELEI
jgi:hypothetical protein